MQLSYLTLLRLTRSTHAALEIARSDEYRGWYELLSKSEQNSLDRMLELLETCEPWLPYAADLRHHASRPSHLGELRSRHEGRFHRVFYAYNPEKPSYLLLSGDTVYHERWYDVDFPRCKAIYALHCKER